MTFGIADISRQVPIRQVGDGKLNSFFGYYNKTNFSVDDRFLLANRTPMFTGNLTGKEVAEVGYFDLQDGDRWHKLGETTAWNWQMGCQLQWVGSTGKIIYNTRATGASGPANVYPDFRSTVVDPASGESYELPLPIYVMAPNGAFALTLNYSRFIATHKTIGYLATEQEPELELAPEDDGVWRMDIATGKTELILSLRQLFDFQHVPSMDKAMHWITHMEVNPSGTRFLFIHRWTERPDDEFCYLHRLFTMNGDGSDLRLLEDTDHPLPQLEADYDPSQHGTFDYEKSIYQISHPLWKSDDEIIVWGPHDGEIHYQLYDDRSGAVTVIGRGILTENGHMTYGRDGRWMLSDTYPDDRTNQRALFLFDTHKDRRYDLGAFYTPSDLGKHNRCDLHPRWSRSNNMVCIDSVHEGSRQMYLLDISGVRERL
ncbi:hypothetical protein GCM10007276_01460 [Agaricicola taiwanensis]|uniref:Uncharacterized protein n=1 Tax=Agaricicola taiwanensis TaxID=591372 RepID=A0A8J2YEB4_9RHOB|nr:hypothetical protein [Agaricicola taiwanensis]GGE27979.1 hypothetical protein GCM10007276_01460 [Agaricicola taiwanensis]